MASGRYTPKPAVQVLVFGLRRPAAIDPKRPFAIGGLYVDIDSRKCSILMVKRLLLLSAMYLPFASAFACFTPPDYSKTLTLELVNRSNSIVLARAVSVSGAESKHSIALFEFEVSEVISGVAPTRFKLDGFLRDTTVAMPQDFHGHTSRSFDGDTNGNSVILPSCEIYGVFEVGETYLIFDVDQPHFKAYENIKLEDDYWLVKIRSIVERSIEIQRSLDGES